MFTGIVEEMGRVSRLTPAGGGVRLRVEAPSLSTGLTIGDSIAVNGACLTVVGAGNGWFEADVVEETLTRTNLGVLEPGAPVDLERPMPASGRFDGHIVQGHVDGMGRVVAVTREDGSARMRISVPPSLERYVIEKGSITVDGVSLTVAGVEAGAFEVALIPHTLAVTVLGRLRVGDAVNLEADVIAKYVERLLEEVR